MSCGVLRDKELNQLGVARRRVVKQEAQSRLTIWEVLQLYLYGTLSAGTNKQRPRQCQKRSVSKILSQEGKEC